MEFPRRGQARTCLSILHGNGDTFELNANRHDYPPNMRPGAAQYEEDTLNRGTCCFWAAGLFGKSSQIQHPGPQLGRYAKRRETPHPRNGTHWWR